jgi:hypothetical protein
MTASRTVAASLTGVGMEGSQETIALEQFHRPRLCCAPVGAVNGASHSAAVGMLPRS